MRGVRRIFALGAFLFGAANAQSMQQVVRSDSATGEKHVGCYYGVWAYTRPGLGEFWPEDIDVSLCDVIYYGFGNVLNHTYEVCTWDPWFDMGPIDFGEQSIKNCVQERDGDVWTPGCTTESGLEYCHYNGIRRTLALKEKNPDLKVLFSVGGWTAGGWIFSDMAQNRTRRTMFIQSAVHFMNYFGLDGIDLDWEFPAYDMLPEVPTDPEDKQHFTALMKEMGEAFKKHEPPYLLTFAAAADPYKANNAYYLDEVHPHVDWFNVMAYDYHGAWDNFTGIDQPLYGKWEESFVGHPMYQFNMHDTIQYYIDNGVPPEKLVLGVHTEGKAWVLEQNATAENCPGPDCPAGIYCPAESASPNMTYSRQEGWMFYYEVLQFFYNDTIPDAELPTHWPDLKPGLEHWTIYDGNNGNQDGCYMAPFAYQNRYWISYDDENSADLKARYANHYGLKGTFVWEVDTDNFRGLFNFRPFTILATLNDAAISGQGLTGNEILGHGHENKGRCEPEAPMCDGTWPTPPRPTGPLSTVAPQCVEDTDCEMSDVICDNTYSNCNYCNETLGCLPGCATDANCQGDMVCDGAHLCQQPGLPIVFDLIVKTKSCSGCATGNVEQGLQVQLTGLLGLTNCTTENLDNTDAHDYGSGAVAHFGRDSGLGGCGIDLNQAVDSGSVAWTGAGTWTPESQDTICVDFYGDNNNNCCCQLGQALTQADGFKPLSNCHC